MPAPIQISLDDEMISSLDALASRVNRSRDWLIEQAVANYVALQDWQIAKIERGMAAANADDFATDEEVQRVRHKHASSACDFGRVPRCAALA